MNDSQIKSLSEAIEASKAGDYSLSVLTSFRFHWQQEQTFSRWLDYMIFKRQLGYPLSPVHLNLAEDWKSKPAISRYLNGIWGHKARQLQNLIAEVRLNPTQPATQPLYRAMVAQWRAQESDNRESLINRLSSSSAIIVGNSPNIKGSNLGAKIDNSDIIFRFNQYSSAHTSKADIGEKLTVWVMAPGYHGPVPENAEYVIVTGPNMLWWQQNWQTLQNHSGKIIGVPLNYWQQCVKDLSAPPSAGYLLTYFLTQLPSHSLKITGFGQSEGARYHHALRNHQANMRHNWKAEGLKMKQWMQKYAL